MDEDKTELSIDCYNKLMRLLDVYANADVISQVIDFYSKNKKQNFEEKAGVESKKKVSKK